MGFLGPLRVESYPGGKWLLVEALCYRSKSGELVTVPSGVVTDLASIPKPFRLFFSVNGSHRKAAVLHDDQYKIKSRTRLECDQLFLEAMESCGVNWLKRWSMYLGVRAGGWMFY